MKPFRYAVYFGSASICTIGIVMLTRNDSIGLAVFLTGAAVSHIGKPFRKKEPFWTCSRKEWIALSVVLLLAVSMLIYALRLPPQLHPKNHEDLGLLEAIVILAAMYGILGFEAFKERKLCLSERCR